MPSIVFTGGGSAGHVTPNLALVARLKELGWKIDYIGSRDGIEKGIVSEWDISFYHISSGKLRRYFDLKNIKDPFKVLKGVWDAYRILRRLRPDVVFSKGGFVTVPVVAAARLLRIPAILHESDLTPGLANRISTPLASRICVTFPETLKALPSDKAVLTGIPIRPELSRGSKDKGWAYSGLAPNKPVLLVMGGSLGSSAINEAIRSCLPELLEAFHVIHICGKGRVDPSFTDKHYRQLEYVSKELPDLLAITDMIVSRAGATSIFEFLSLHKPMLLIPLTKQASRGDQILNAQSFEKSGYSKVLYEENLTKDSLLAAVKDLYRERAHYIGSMREHDAKSSVEAILRLIQEHVQA